MADADLRAELARAADANAVLRRENATLKNLLAERDALERVRAEQATLVAENERLRKLNASGLRFKVSEKGAVSVYGFGRFPVTLYREQWDKLLGVVEDLRAFIDANSGKLRTKGDKAQKILRMR